MKNLIGLVVALTGLAAVVIQPIVAKINADNLLSATKYEVTYAEKHKSYAALLKAADQYMFSALPHQKEEMEKLSVEVENRFYLVLPYLHQEDREKAKDLYRALAFEMNRLHALVSKGSIENEREGDMVIWIIAEIQRLKTELSDFLLKTMFVVEE